VPVALDASFPAPGPVPDLPASTRGRRGWRRTAIRRRWFDIDDDPVLLCECADGEHTC